MGIEKGETNIPTPPNIAGGALLSRHTAKYIGKEVEEPYNPKDPEMKGGLDRFGNEKEKAPIPARGIFEGHRYAGMKMVEALEELSKNAPEYVVGVFSRSSEARTSELLGIIQEDVSRSTRPYANPYIDENGVSHDYDKKAPLEGAEVFSLGKWGAIDNVGKGISPDKKKIIIIGDEKEKALGIKSWNMDEIPKIAEENGISLDWPDWEDRVYKLWIGNEEVQNRIGVKPVTISMQYKAMIGNRFAELKKNFPGKKVIIVAVGHSWELDCFIQSMLSASNARTFEKMGGIINTSEGFKLELEEGEIEKRVGLDKRIAKTLIAKIYYRGAVMEGRIY